jgi:hypothetical protein
MKKKERKKIQRRLVEIYKVILKNNVVTKKE